MPSTRTTERPGGAATSGSSAIAASGGATGVVGPTIDGAGSTRSSALSTGPDGGISSLRLRRISERCTSSRRSSAPGACSATAPKTQAMPSATAGDQRRAAGAVGEVEPVAAADQPLAQAQRHALQGHGDERLPPTVPRARPTAARRANCPFAQHQRRQPAAGEGAPPRSRPGVSAPTISPCRYPQIPRASVKATMPQSRTVKHGMKAGGEVGGPVTYVQ